MRECKVTQELLQPVVFCAGAVQDRDSGVCVFPKCEEGLVGSFRLGPIRPGSQATRQVKVWDANSR